MCIRDRTPHPNMLGSTSSTAIPSTCSHDDRLTSGAIAEDEDDQEFATPTMQGLADWSEETSPWGSEDISPWGSPLGSSLSLGTNQTQRSDIASLGRRGSDNSLPSLSSPKSTKSRRSRGSRKDSSISSSPFSSPHLNSVLQADFDGEGDRPVSPGLVQSPVGGLKQGLPYDQGWRKVDPAGSALEQVKRERRRRAHL
eukprot:TRINITY_DN5484_c0_g1_i2.p1 TRINITY_DN5484_c0_g1~~TRINITY_DN5484_c0_g1_i2.p1  ORF type:complete len:198 (-),score=35.33 TRINITY_DN5484_c0_g1_i2:414-1007(-)